jgi:hypothetical protein
MPALPPVTIATLPARPISIVMTSEEPDVLLKC